MILNSHQMVLFPYNRIFVRFCSPYHLIPRCEIWAHALHAYEMCTLLTQGTWQTLVRSKMLSTFMQYDHTIRHISPQFIFMLCLACTCITLGPNTCIMLRKGNLAYIAHKRVLCTALKHITSARMSLCKGPLILPVPKKISSIPMSASDFSNLYRRKQDLWVSRT
jgi:hypothetical protein